MHHGIDRQCIVETYLFSPPTTAKKQPQHGLIPDELEDVLAVVSVMGSLMMGMTAMHEWIGLPWECICHH